MRFAAGAEYPTSLIVSTRWSRATWMERLLNSSAAHAEELSFRKMPSGAGHDALSFAHLYPTAMVFIPCKDGISHNIAEYTSPEQIEAGVRVLVRFLLQGEGGDKQALDQ